MEMIKKITVLLALVLAFGFVMVLLSQSGADDPVTIGWAKESLENTRRAANLPIWKITQNGTFQSVDWINHSSNQRFAIYDPGTPADQSDDLVLDKETRLIWSRDANKKGEAVNLIDSTDYIRNFILGYRKGWTLPTIEELSSLLDFSQPGSPDYPLPSGHPFINVQPGKYWTQSSIGAGGAPRWCMDFSNGNAITLDWLDTGYLWLVRGGRGCNFDPEPQ